ncbi:DUF3854 domain-containing protein [Actinomadura miaoliensis]|uniref:DUF3854 domain-containing protein n=1 Tax=Actinomadura miaoliensis TaxID=430685 RepID=A0ABP7WWN5_9ACTN
MSHYGAAIFPQHAALLEASAISSEVARARGYVSVDTKKRLENAGFERYQRSVPGLLIPLRRADGSVWGYQYRPDTPRTTPAGNTIKYETPKGQRNGIDVPIGIKDVIGDPSVPLWVTEGSRKADAAVSAGLACVSLSGVWGWRGSSAQGGKRAVPDWHDIALNGRRVVLAFDSDAMTKQQVHHALGQLAEYLASKGADVQYLHLPQDDDGKTGLDDYIAAHGADGLAALIRPDLPMMQTSLPSAGTGEATETRPAADRPADVADSASDQGRGPSQASILVKIARGRFELFMSDDGRPYAVAKNGPNIALPLRGRAGLRSLLAKIYADEQGGAVPSQSALADAMTVLEGVAQTAEPRTPHLRVARDGERVVIDLGTTDGRCVVVGPDGWERCPRSPVLFRRSGAMKSLPDPVSDGDGLARLGELLNVDTDSFRLLVAWLAAAFIPDLPHPILAFRGEQGTGKSKSAQMVIGIIDPSGAPKRTAPRDVKSWATQAFNSWGLCLDNVSYIPDWLSDALCRAVTGDGIVDRALYTDDDVVVLEFRRVLALTTIDAGALAGDLAERLLTIELSLIKDSERREEAELDRAFADAHAAILASLFDLLAQVLKALPDVRLTERPRMADFARVLAAVDHITGWSTLKHYTDGARNAVADVLEGEPFAQAVVELVCEAGPDGVKLTAQQILDTVRTPERLPKKWPRDATRAGGQLKRLAPALRTIGVEFTEKRDGRGRFYVLTASEELRNNRAESPGIEGASERHQRHQTPPKGALTSGNNGDAEQVTLASHGRGSGGAGDAGDAGGDAGPMSASPRHGRADQGKQARGDADDASDAETQSLSKDATPALGTIGECAGCGGPMRIIAPGQTCHPNDNCERQARDRGAA